MLPLHEYISLCSYFRFIHRLIKKDFFFVCCSAHTHTHHIPKCPKSNSFEREAKIPHILKTEKDLDLSFLSVRTYFMFGPKDEKKNNEIRRKIEEKDIGTAAQVKRTRTRKSEKYTVEESPHRLKCFLYHVIPS